MEASATRFNVWRQQTAAFEDVSAYEYGGAGLQPDRRSLSGTDPRHSRLGRLFPSAWRAGALRPPFHRRGRSPQRPPRRGSQLWTVAAPFRRRSAHARQNHFAEWRALSRWWESWVPASIPNSTRRPTSGCLSKSIPPAATTPNIFNVVARLKPGVTLGMANAQLHLAADEFRRKFPEHHGTARRLQRPAFSGCHRQRRAPVSFGAGRRGQLRAADRLRQRGQSFAGARHGPQARDRRRAPPWAPAAAALSANCSPKAWCCPCWAAPWDWRSAELACALCWP